MGATAGYNKVRKLELVKSREIACGFCQYHKNENNFNQRRHPSKPRSKDHHWNMVDKRGIA